jgi:hypothetical protein
VLRGILNLEPDNEEETENEEHPAISSESKDVKELTVLAYLVDALIDAPSGFIDELQKCALTETDFDQLLFPLLNRFKPFQTLWDRIKLALEKDFNLEQNEDWPTKDFKFAVWELGRFISPVNSKVEAPEDLWYQRLERWKELVGLAETALKNNPDMPPASMNTEDPKRLNRVVYHTILWAIHNRGVMNIQWVSNPTDYLEYRKLMKHIEKLLRKYPVRRLEAEGAV